MNHRRALRVSTDAGLTIFVLMIVGVVMWTVDESLGWNLLPDWIDKYAQALVMVLSILAGFAVVMSVMCSLAVMAESAAEKAGITAPKPSRGARALAVVAVIAVFAVMFGLHKLDQYRAAARADEIRVALGDRMPEILPLFSDETKDLLTADPSPEGDEAVARLLKAIRTSTPHEPSVRVLVPAEPPYTHCAIAALDRPYRPSSADDWEYLRREYLAGFPTDWERDAVEAAFDGGEMQVPPRECGVFINTRLPSGWGTLSRDDRVVAILMLRASP